MEQAPVFELCTRVTPEDIDQLGHVNNIVYLRWVQEVAVAHWFACAPEDEKATLTWIVLRHEIDYKRPGHLEDEITLRTWVGNSSRLRFERHTQILRRADGALLAEALTVWCPISLETRRPVSVSERVRGNFSSVSDRPEPSQPQNMK